MPRPLIPGIARPRCPKPEHAGARIWLYGHYARNSRHRRPRFLCVPPRVGIGRGPSWTRHAFVERPPRRQPTRTHPLGQSCQSCWHVAAHHEGPQTGSRFSFTIREAANALVRVGEGLMLRTSSYKVREHRWPSDDPLVPADVSNHAQLAMNYLDAFADEVYSRYAETSWPEAVILDASPQREKDLKVGGAKKQGGKRVFSILGAYGYPAGKKAGGKLWRLAVHGAENQYEWGPQRNPAGTNAKSQIRKASTRIPAPRGNPDRIQAMLRSRVPRNEPMRWGPMARKSPAGSVCSPSARRLVSSTPRTRGVEIVRMKPSSKML